LTASVLLLAALGSMVPELLTQKRGYLPHCRHIAVQEVSYPAPVESRQGRPRSGVRVVGRGAHLGHEQRDDEEAPVGEFHDSSLLILVHPNNPQTAGMQWCLVGGIQSEIAVLLLVRHRTAIGGM
jgi:hypothetical protein